MQDIQRDVCRSGGRESDGGGVHQSRGGDFSGGIAGQCSEGDSSESDYSHAAQLMRDTGAEDGSQYGSSRYKEGGLGV